MLSGNKESKQIATVYLVAAAAVIGGLGVMLYRRLCQSAVGAAGSKGSSSAGNVLVAKDFLRVTLAEKTAISPDTFVFRFALPNPTDRLALPVGQHFYIKVTDPDLQRPYTPTSSPEQQGFIDFVIKVYRPSPPAFPEGGRMTQRLEALPIGGQVLLKQSMVRMQYQPPGVVCVKPSAAVASPASPSGLHPLPRVDRFVLVAGGSGITPMWQIIQAVLSNPSDTTNITLLYGNRTVSDVLLLPELTALAKKATRPDQLKIVLTLSQPPKDGSWEHGTGRISKELLAAHVSVAEGKSPFVFLCGPPALVNETAKPALASLGVPESNVFSC